MIAAYASRPTVCVRHRIRLTGSSANFQWQKSDFSYLELNGTYRVIRSFLQQSEKPVFLLRDKTSTELFCSSRKRSFQQGSASVP